MLTKENLHLELLSAMVAKGQALFVCLKPKLHCPSSFFLPKDFKMLYSVATICN